MGARETVEPGDTTKTTLKILLPLVAVLSCFASPVFAHGPIKNVPETLSPLWLAVPIAGMLAFSFLRRKKE
jgi:hypothetical protein